MKQLLEVNFILYYFFTFLVFEVFAFEYFHQLQKRNKNSLALSYSQNKL